MTTRRSRRDFLRDAVRGAAAGVAGAGLLTGTRGAWAAAGSGEAKTAASDRLNIGIIGAANRAERNLDEEGGAVAGENIVALCDVDERLLARTAGRFPRAARYADFRKLLERKDLDALVISTADHTHAAATLLALESGRHVYCEKPLAHTVHEARSVAEAAKRTRRVTQIGTQIHAGRNYRRVVELVQSGAIGAVKEVHVFIGKSWGAREPGRPADPPAHLNYDLWLGPVPHRPYRADFHPSSWRKYWAFGNGSLGDMGCHYMDLPFWALGLRHPTRVRAEGPPVHAEVCPEWLEVHYEFPARGAQPPVKLTWYDGGRKPAGYDAWGLRDDWKNGVMFVGEKGNLIADYNRHRLLPEKQFEGFAPPKPTLADSIGHHKEWLEACRRNDPTATLCHFGYSGPLTEAVLLGGVAYRAGKELEWDAAGLKPVNAPEADALIRPAVRKGWRV
jgi:predicted dehydrogenase